MSKTAQQEPAKGESGCTLTVIANNQEQTNTYRSEEEGDGWDSDAICSQEVEALDSASRRKLEAEAKEEWGPIMARQSPEERARTMNEGLVLIWKRQRRRDSSLRARSGTS